MGMRLRASTGHEVDRVAAVECGEPVGWIGGGRFREELAQGMYRPEWSWIAEQDGTVVARALWWGPAEARHPVALDCLTVDPAVPDRAGVAAGLLKAGLRALAEAGCTEVPQYLIEVPDGWRGDPAAVEAVTWRRAAAREAGLTDEVERLQLEWTPGSGVPAADGRLAFGDGSDDEFLAVFEQLTLGSLDARTRRSLEVRSAAETAREEMAFYLGAPGERAWWRLARTAGDPADGGGRLVGMALPSATPYHRNVGYLGVLPEHRGHGYVDGLLAEITRIHADAGADRITATTDLGNAPMAVAFARAGYRATRIRLVLTAPDTC